MAYTKRGKQLFETATRAVVLATVGRTSHNRCAVHGHFTCMDNTTPNSNLAMQHSYETKQQYERTPQANRPHTRLAPTPQYTNTPHSIGALVTILS